MRTKLRATIVALGLMAGALPASTAVHASPVPPPRSQKPIRAKAVTKISGIAGKQAIIDVSRPTSLGNGGADSPTKVSSGRWGGVLLARVDDDFKHLDTDWFAHYRFEEDTACPGKVCMDSLATHFVWGGTPGDGTFELAPGRYAVVLLGDSGSQVRTTLKLPGLPKGTISAVAGKKADLTVAFDESIGTDGHHAVNRGYEGDDKPGPRFDGYGVVLAGSTPAVGNSTQCFTESAEPGLSPTGLACLQGGGEPPLPPMVGTEADSTLYGFDFFAKPTTTGYLTLGWDAEMVAAESRITVMRFSVVF